MANGKVMNKLLYIAYLPNYWDAYDVSKIGKQETKNQLESAIGLTPTSNTDGSGSEVVDSWTVGEQVLGEVL